MEPHRTTEIVVGPIFVTAEKADGVSDAVAHVGAAMEFATQTSATRIPLFRKRWPSMPNRFQFDDLVIHQNDLPCEVQYRLFFAAQTPVGTFVPLEGVMVSMFREFKIGRTMLEVLKDLSETVDMGYAHQRRPGLLHGSLEKNGYGLSSITSYGRSVNGAICWCPPSERHKSDQGGILVSWMDFRPKPDGTLGNGTWKELWKETICYELHRAFQDGFRQRPIDILTKEGENSLLAEFQWTPLARMTAKQAREARIAFIREHPALKDTPKELAAALQNAGLYAESTTIQQVMKFLPSIISASGA